MFPTKNPFIRQSRNEPRKVIDPQELLRDTKYLTGAVYVMRENDVAAQVPGRPLDLEQQWRAQDKDEREERRRARLRSMRSRRARFSMLEPWADEP